MNRYRLTGISFILLLVLTTAPKSAVGTSGVGYEFNIDGNMEGWGRTNSVSALTVSDGVLQCTVVGEDPHFESSWISANALENQVVLIRMKVSEPGSGQIYWATSNEPDMDESKSYPLSRVTNEWQLYILNLKNHPKWIGIITQLRIDPPESSGEVLVDFVRICSAASIRAAIIEDSFNHIMGNGVEYYETSRTAYIDNGVIRVGIDKDWGGAIREIWYNDTNIINNYDSGRLAGISVYDGRVRDNYNESNNYEDWGWNPVPSDKYGHINRPQIISFHNNTLYVKSLNLQWNPDDKDGGPQDAVPSDLLVETWITLFSDSPHLIQLFYKVTHVGTDYHLGQNQEFPYTYVNRGFDRVVFYNGSRPWVGENVSIIEAPLWPGQKIVSSENWVALINDKGIGLTFYAPYDYPFFTVHHFSISYEVFDTNYVNQFNVQEYSPGKVYENTFYYLVGDWQDSRAAINELRKQIEDRDSCSPFGFLESPGSGANLSSITSIQGWAVDNVRVEKVEVKLNNSTLGLATYGLTRQDVADDTLILPNSPNYGYSFELDTRKFPNGEYTLHVNYVDSSGNEVTPFYGEVSVRFDNQAVSTIDIDEVRVSDTRCDLGTKQTASLHASWSVDGSDVVDGVINIGQSYKTNSTGWLTIEATRDMVGIITYNVSGVNCNGITSFNQMVPSPSIIYDRVRIVEGGVSGKSVSVNQPVIVWYKAVYEYDSEVFDGSKGTLSVNGEPATWSSANQRWEKTYTENVARKQSFKVSAVTDSKYGLTKFTDVTITIDAEWVQTGISGYPYESIIIGVILVIIILILRSREIVAVNSLILTPT